MNSIDWPTRNVWVFIAQLLEQCSANGEATGTNPVEAPKIFLSGLIRNRLNCDYNFISNLCVLIKTFFYFFFRFLPIETQEEVTWQWVLEV